MTKETPYNHDAVSEVFFDFKRGLRTKKTATAELVKQGFQPDIAAFLLADMKKVSLTEMQNCCTYSPAISRLAGGRYRKRKARRLACANSPSNVETDNKPEDKICPKPPTTD